MKKGETVREKGSVTLPKFKDTFLLKTQSKEIKIKIEKIIHKNKMNAEFINQWKNKEGCSVQILTARNITSKFKIKQHSKQFKTRHWRSNWRSKIRSRLKEQIPSCLKICNSGWFFLELLLPASHACDACWSWLVCTCMLEFCLIVLALNPSSINEDVKL